MSSNDDAVPLARLGRSTLVPALICAAVCVSFMQAGFLTVLFLVPLGICCAAFGANAAWLSSILAALGNGVLSAGLSLFYGIKLANAGLDSLYFLILTFGFTWIVAGSPPSLPPIRTLWRFIGSAAAGACAFLGMIFATGKDESFVTLLRSQIDALSSMFISSAGADAAQQAFLERLLTPDRIIDMLTSIALRGGALVSISCLFFFSLQAAFFLVRLFRRNRYKTAGGLAFFHAPGRTIWIVIMCLPLIVLFQYIPFKFIEIVLWNILTTCVIMYLAQGCGIVLFALARRPRPVISRLFFGIAVIFLMFSPGINLLIIGILVLLGIAENWLPLRKKVVDREERNQL